MKKENQKVKQGVASMLTAAQVSLGLDQDKTTFLPGQTIHGFLSIQPTVECRLMILRVKFIGQATTTLLPFTGHKSQNFSSVTLFRDIENYVDDPTLVSAGEHVFPFTFRVPPTHLPASFIVLNLI